MENTQSKFRSYAINIALAASIIASNMLCYYGGKKTMQDCLFLNATDSNRRYVQLYLNDTKRSDSLLEKINKFNDIAAFIKPGRVRAKIFIY